MTFVIEPAHVDRNGRQFFPAFRFSLYSALEGISCGARICRVDYRLPGDGTGNGGQA